MTQSQFSKQHNLKLKLQRLSNEKRKKKDKNRELYLWECDHRKRRSKSSINTRNKIFESRMSRDAIKSYRSIRSEKSVRSRYRSISRNRRQKKYERLNRSHEKRSNMSDDASSNSSLKGYFKFGR